MSKKEPVFECPRVCAFCEHASATPDRDAMLCFRCGIVSADHVCRKFRYDPLKRKPTEAPRLILPDAEEMQL